MIWGLGSPQLGHRESCWCGEVPDTHQPFRTYRMCPADGPARFGLFIVKAYGFMNTAINGRETWWQELQRAVVFTLLGPDASRGRPCSHPTPYPHSCTWFQQTFRLAEVQAQKAELKQDLSEPLEGWSQHDAIPTPACPGLLAEWLWGRAQDSALLQSPQILLLLKVSHGMETPGI